MNFKELKSKQLNEASTYRVYGHEIEYDSDDDQPAQARRGWKPFSPCHCTHDSPNNPCPCMHGIWWLPPGSIVAKGHADRKDHDGRALQYYDLATDATILVESVQSVSVQDLKQGAALSDDGGVGVIAAIKLTQKQREQLAKALWWLGQVLLTYAVEDVLNPLPGFGGPMPGPK